MRLIRAPKRSRPDLDHPRARLAIMGGPVGAGFSSSSSTAPVTPRRRGCLVECPQQPRWIGSLTLRGFRDVAVSVYCHFL